MTTILILFSLLIYLKFLNKYTIQSDFIDQTQIDKIKNKKNIKEVKKRKEEKKKKTKPLQNSLEPVKITKIDHIKSKTKLYSKKYSNERFKSFIHHHVLN